ncbi:hypothetical protein Ciccas_004735 [Cichlidogyrus casuarinus]|uniref:Uncharacterized protein n=1 Tax=Cichlidogyrus casuarinus TaxID=1844966 RepID=A0ABD2QBH5_9PLAT
MLDKVKKSKKAAQVVKRDSSSNASSSEWSQSSMTEGNQIYESMYDKIKRRTNKDQAQMKEALKKAKKLAKKKKKKKRQEKEKKKERERDKDKSESRGKLSRVIMNDRSSSSSSEGSISSRSSSFSSSTSGSDTDRCLSDDARQSRKQQVASKTRLSASEHQKLLRQLSVSPTSDSSSSTSPPPMLPKKLKTARKNSADLAPSKQQQSTKKQVSGSGALMKKTKKSFAMSSYSTTKRLIEEQRKRPMTKETLKTTTPPAGKKAKMLKSPPPRMRYPTSSSSSEEEPEREQSRLVKSREQSSSKGFDSSSDSSQPRISRSCSPESDTRAAASTSSGHSRQLASPLPDPGPTSAIPSDNLEVALAPFEPEQEEVTITSSASGTDIPTKPSPELEFISAQIPANKPIMMPQAATFQLPVATSISLPNGTQAQPVLTALPQPVILATPTQSLPIIQGLNKDAMQRPRFTLGIVKTASPTTLLISGPLKSAQSAIGQTIFIPSTATRTDGTQHRQLLFTNTAPTPPLPKTTQLLQLANPTTVVSAAVPVPAMATSNSVATYVSNVIARVKLESNGEVVSSPNPLPPNAARARKTSPKKPLVPIAQKLPEDHAILRGSSSRSVSGPPPVDTMTVGLFIQ